MDKKNFIETLRRALYGKTDHTSLEEHIRYYETYIDQEMSKGRTEKEVLDELGDPRLIARTILETSGRRSSYMEYTVEESPGDDRIGDSGASFRRMESYINYGFIFRCGDPAAGCSIQDSGRAASDSYCGRICTLADQKIRKVVFLKYRYILCREISYYPCKHLLQEVLI